MRWAIAVSVAGVVLAGCAGIPSSGPVQRVAEDRGLGQSTVRYAPVGPSRGASPQQIVRGYLDAMLAYPVSTGTAAKYLTPRAADEWQSSEGVTVYSKPQATLGAVLLDYPRAAVQVDLRVNEAARLDRQGHFTRVDGRSRSSYVLEKVKGQWRITNPQKGVMVTRTYYGDYFRPFPLYFFDASGKRLVPDVVHLAVGDQLSTGLVTSLARGPARTPGTLRTYVPGAGALRPSVTVGHDDVADVEFSTSLAKLSAAERDRLAAQIVWTLRSVPGLKGVRIFGSGAVLLTSGEHVNPVDSWAQFGPPAAEPHPSAVVDDKVVEIDGDAVRPISGRWGRDAGGAVDAAVDDDAVAAVMRGRRQVRVTDREGDKPFGVDGAGFITPEWDDGRLWLVDRKSSGATRVRIVEGKRTRTLPASGLRGLRVSSIALAPDGGRYAVTGRDGRRTSIYVGPVERDKRDRLTGLGTPRRLSIAVDDPRSIDWVSMTRVGFLGGSDAGVQLYAVAIDGTGLTGGDTGGGPLLPDVDAASRAGGTEDDPACWVVDGQNRLWYLQPEKSWRLIDDRRFSDLSTGS